MSVGFRKSLLGFNCDDVMKYIENAQRTHAENEVALNKKIDELNGSIAVLEKNISSVSAERDEIAAQLKEFNMKYEEIDRLSQNIGKLYLVAQSNAQAIINNSAESSLLAAAEIEKNISAISETQASLDDIRREMMEISNSFSTKLEELSASLTQTRDKITENTADSHQHHEQFNAVVKMLDE